MVKTYNVCVVMNLNQKYVIKLLFLRPTAYLLEFTYLLEFRCNFYFMPVPQPWVHSGAASLKFFCSPQILVPRKVRFKHIIKTKILSP